MTTTPDENTIRKVTKIVDFARQLESDVRSVVPQIEPIVKATDALREAAAAKGLNRRQRLALGDAISKQIRTDLE